MNTPLGPNNPDPGFYIPRECNLIGLCGLSGSGKDSIADVLVKERHFVKVGLADPLKRFCQEAFDFTDNQLWGPSEARNAPDMRYPRNHTWLDDGDKCACCGLRWHAGPSTSQCYLTPRFALQRLGTEWGRVCHEDTWINIALRVAKKLRKSGYGYDARSGVLTISSRIAVPVVISDVRFENEARAIEAQEGKVWKVEGRQNASTPSHASERLAVSPGHIALTILNDGSLESLKSGALLALDEYTKGQHAHLKGVVISSASKDWKDPQALLGNANSDLRDALRDLLDVAACVRSSIDKDATNHLNMIDSSMAKAREALGRKMSGQ